MGNTLVTILLLGTYLPSLNQRRGEKRVRKPLQNNRKGKHIAAEGKRESTLGQQ